jgi:hypothetical protein
MSLLAMSLQRTTLRRAGGHLGAAIAMIVIGGLALLAAQWDLGEQRRLRSEAESQLGTLQAERDELEQSLDMLEGNIERFRALQRGGFIGGGDRIAWTEALLRARQRLGLPDTAFELAPQKMLEPAAVDPAMAGVDLPAPIVSGPLAHDLHVRIDGIHEGELLDLIAVLRAEGVGFFRAQGCALQRDLQAAGLQLDCTLRFVTYLPAEVIDFDDPDGAMEIAE